MTMDEPPPLLARSDPAAAACGLTAIVTGAGPRVVLVHGALGDYRQWAPIAGRLQARYRVVDISRRYHWPNAAPSPDAPYSYESHRDDLLTYLRASGGPVHLVGHSYGAGIVLLAALREPRAIRSLVLIEPPFGSLLPDTTPDLEDELADRLSTIATVQALARTGDTDGASRRLIEWAQGGPGGFAALGPDIQRALLENAATIGPTYATAPPAVSCDALRHLRTRTLVVNGERTRRFYRAVGDRAAACIPGARRARIPQAGHMTIVERPEETAALMMTFLAEQAP
jgi:pimeloyl-ACP methyl ester carboxylesterase